MHAGHVAAENIILPMVDMMMGGVTWSRDRPHLNAPDADTVSIFQNSESFARNCFDLSPKSPHFIAENPGRRFDELTRISKCGAPRG